MSLSSRFLPGLAELGEIVAPLPLDRRLLCVSRRIGCLNQLWRRPSERSCSALHRRAAGHHPMERLVERRRIFWDPYCAGDLISFSRVSRFPIRQRFLARGKREFTEPLSDRRFRRPLEREHGSDIRCPSDELETPPRRVVRKGDRDVRSVSGCDRRCIPLNALRGVKGPQEPVCVTRPQDCGGRDQDRRGNDQA